MKKRSLALLVFSFLACALPLLAADWPEFRGPKRDGHAADKGLLQEWPKNGPKLLWTYKDAGIGFSAPSVVGNRIYTMGARNEETYVLCLDADKKGAEVWAKKLGPIFTFQGNVWGDGPRGAPTVDGDHVYVLGGYGDLACFKTDGTEVWRKNLVKDLGGELMSRWGYSESPLVDGDKLICTPGGSKGTLAALNKKDGTVRWRSEGLTASATYASVVAATIGGVRQYIVMTYEDGKAIGVAGVAPADRKLLWQQAILTGTFESYAVIPSPIVQGNKIYVTEGYAAGCQLLEVAPEAGGKFAVKALYNKRAKQVLNNLHGGVVLVDGHVYGHADKRGWVCQNFLTGKQDWLDRNSLQCDSGSIIYGDGRLYLFSDQGEAVLLEPSAKGWEEKGRFTIPQRSALAPKRRTSQTAGVWTHPTIANGRLYLRDQELLFCYDIKK
jgi:outer membrane protein assembly factor BamB